MIIDSNPINICENIKALRITEDNKPLALRFKTKTKDLLSWLNSKEDQFGCYFAAKEGDYEIAGIGKLLELPLDKLDFDYNNFELPIFFYRSFNANSTWKNFGNQKLVVCKQYLERINQDFFLTFVFDSDTVDSLDDTHIKEISKEINSTLNSFNNSLNIKLVDRIDLPSFSEWSDSITATTNNIKNGELEKLVLARKSIFKFDNNLNALKILSNLKNKELNSYSFYIKNNSNECFIGVSPECVLRKRDNTIYSEALAGTVNNSEINETYQSSKLKHEHMLVVKELKTSLKNLCDQVNFEPKPHLVKLRNIAHLKTCFTAILKNKIKLTTIIDELHPNSAICGIPSKQATSSLVELEKFERGLYGGIVGVIKDSQVDLALAIRSIVIKDNLAEVYAGAGIVTGSDAYSEWQELESKIMNFTELFT